MGRLLLPAALNTGFELIVTAEITINVSVNDGTPTSLVSKVALSAHLPGVTQFEAEEVSGQETNKQSRCLWVLL